MPMRPLPVALALLILAAPALRSQAAPVSKAAPDPLVAAADQGRIIGSDQAKLWVLIVSDFQCPFCHQWHSETWEKLRREYVTTGKVRVAYVNMPLNIHPNARPTAIAAMCAGTQGKFWRYADLLFTTQSRWKDLRDPRTHIEALGKTAALDEAKFKACLGSPGVASLVDADYTRMNRAGAGSTPTFFIGASKLEGAQPIEMFRRVIDAELARAR
jgi:protein-disulfide isomerase